MNFQLHYSGTVKKDILSIFSIDLLRFPENNKELYSGQPKYVFRKELSYPECGIFDFIKGYIYEEGRIRNFIFQNVYTGLDIPRIEILVNYISDIYGEDLLGRGAFEDSDRRQLVKGAWVGRVYSDVTRYRSPLILSLINGSLQMTITIKKEKIPVLVN